MKLFPSLATMGSLALIGLSAQAAITTNTSFGNLAGATFAGTGISTASTEIVTLSGLANSDVLTLGLTATPYKVGTVGNNNNGTFSATPGVSPANANRATWNFDFYVGINNGADLSDYTYNLTYTDGTTAGNFDPGLLSFYDAIFNHAPSYGLNGFQDSENIEFYGYNPATPGTYNFDLTVADSNGNIFGDDHITVNVGSVPDAPSTLSLLSIAGAGLAMARRKMSR